VGDTVHLDEKTPHLQIIASCVTPNGGYSSKYFIGDIPANDSYGREKISGNKRFQKYQDDFFEKVSSKYGLERGEVADLDNPDAPKPRKHIPMQQLKRMTANLQKSYDDSIGKVAQLNSQITTKKKTLSDLDKKSEDAKEALGDYEGKSKNLDRREKKLKDETDKAIEKTKMEREKQTGLLKIRAKEIVDRKAVQIHAFYQDDLDDKDTEIENLKKELAEFRTIKAKSEAERTKEKQREERFKNITTVYDSEFEGLQSDKDDYQAGG
jgi:hypothetical protein